MSHSVRLSLLTVLLLALAAVSAPAQDEVVTLRYKFTPNETNTYVMKNTGVLPLSLTPGPEVGAGGNIAFDVVLDMTMTTEQRTESVNEQGEGLVETKTPNLLIRSTMQVMGQPTEVIVNWEKEQLVTTVNGQPQPLDEGQKKLQTMLATPLKLTMTPLGKSTPDAETAKILAQMYNASGLGGVDLSRLSALTSALPEQPVKIGDSWEVKDEAKLGEATMTGSSTLKLTGFEVVNGRRMARIEGQARLSANGQMPGGAAMGMPVQVNVTQLEVAMSFVNHFDIEAGCTPLSEMNLCQNMQMMLSVPATMAGQAMHIPATIENAQMTMELHKQ